ncbi:P-loop protein of unknown function [Methanococcoides vulcani]|uniref:ATP-binding protein n=1 Tax=Methanococcoides vulcani TaxID=1353158 RepID=A0A1I0B7K0_9EURY|nr:BREX system ATP-binding domain-containing protein [Methanococcoides vulcani]SET02493.1 P-loop protein of unknown function [Methanococcoides vulcani]
MGNRPLPDPDAVYDILFSLSETGDPKPGAASVIDVGSEQFIDYIENEILDNFVSSGGSTCRFFEGSYGSGKTHILQLIEDRALENGFVVCHIDLKHDLSFGEWDQITKHILENCYIKYDNRIIRRFPEILEALEHNEFLHRDDYKEIQLQHACFQNAIQYAISRSLLDDNAWYTLRRYLLGEKVRVYELKEAGLKRVKKSLSKNNAEQVLNTVLNSFYYLGLKGTILLFDETDRSWTSSRKPIPKRVTVAANLIRRFIDSCSSGEIAGTVATFAVLPNFIRDCIDCYPALGQRLEVQWNDATKMSWRSPILPVNAVNSYFLNVENPLNQRELFLEHAINKFKSLVEYCGGNTDDIENDFQTIGRQELQNWAGDEYKRAIIRALTTCAVDRIDEYRV